MENEKKAEFHEAVNILLDGRTNKWLADKTGIANSEISRILNGRLLPSDIQREKIKLIFPKELAKY